MVKCEEVESRSSRERDLGIPRRVRGVANDYLTSLFRAIIVLRGFTLLGFRKISSFLKGANAAGGGKPSISYHNWGEAIRTLVTRPDVSLGNS